MTRARGQVLGDIAMEAMRGFEVKAGESPAEADRRRSQLVKDALIKAGVGRKAAGAMAERGIGAAEDVAAEMGASSLHQITMMNQPAVQAAAREQRQESKQHSFIGNALARFFGAGMWRRGGEALKKAGEGPDKPTFASTLRDLFGTKTKDINEQLEAELAESDMSEDEKDEIREKAQEKIQGLAKQRQQEAMVAAGQAGVSQVKKGIGAVKRGFGWLTGRGRRDGAATAPSAPDADARKALEERKDAGDDPDKEKGVPLVKLAPMDKPLPVVMMNEGGAPIAKG
jgi:hypothetical protein